MTNSENYDYYNKFKVDVIGGFYAIDDLDILKNYLEEIKDKYISFIVISSGTSGKDVIPICKKYSFVKEVIIFCANYSYNEHYIKEYPGYVKKVLTSINSVYEYIKTFTKENEITIEQKNFIEKYKFSSEEIKMNKQIQQTPIITSSEYDKCYFLVHRAYAHFFGDINKKENKPAFSKENFCKVLDCIQKIQIYGNGDIDGLIKQFKSLLEINDNNIFVEKSIKEYTRDSSFCYILNKMMRNFESGLVKFSYYMGPFLFALNKYVKENPNYAMSKDMTLYRNMTCPKLDFYLFKLNVGHIICFPSLTSTSSEEKHFSPTGMALAVNKVSGETIDIKMIIKYKYSQKNISPGIIIEDKVGHDGCTISCFPGEKEVLLFPFTSLKIKSIKPKNEYGKNIQIIEMEIINRTSYIEYTLKNNVNNRLFLSSLE